MWSQSALMWAYQHALHMHINTHTHLHMNMSSNKKTRRCSAHCICKFSPVLPGDDDNAIAIQIVLGDVSYLMISIDAHMLSYVTRTMLWNHPFASLTSLAAGFFNTGNEEELFFHLCQHVPFPWTWKLQPSLFPLP